MFKESIIDEDLDHRVGLKFKDKLLEVDKWDRVEGLISYREDPKYQMRISDKRGKNFSSLVFEGKNDEDTYDYLTSYIGLNTEGPEDEIRLNTLDLLYDGEIFNRIGLFEIGDIYYPAPEFDYITLHHELGEKYEDSPFSEVGGNFLTIFYSYYIEDSYEMASMKYFDQFTSNREYIDRLMELVLVFKDRSDRKPFETYIDRDYSERIVELAYKNKRRIKKGLKPKYQKEFTGNKYLDLVVSISYMRTAIIMELKRCLIKYYEK